MGRKRERSEEKEKRGKGDGKREVERREEEAVGGESKVKGNYISLTYHFNLSA